MARSKTTAVAKASNKAVGQVDWSRYGDAGHENIGADDVQIPYLKLLNANSAQCKKSDKANYVPGAQEGMILLVPEQRLIDGEQGILFVPCVVARQIAIMKPDGAGMIGVHPYDPKLLLSASRNDKNQLVDDEGNNLVEQYTYAGLLLTENYELDTRLSFRMGGTSTSTAKRMNTLSKGYRTPNGALKPLFSQVYRFTTKPTQNDKNSWYVWDVQHDSELTQPDIIDEAAKLYEIASV